MSILNFPEDQTVGIIETGGEIILGGFTVETGKELQFIRALIYIHNVTPANETLKLVVCSDAACTRPIFESTEFRLDSITDLQTSGYWYGLVRFDFSRQGWSPDTERFIKIVTTSYTRNGDISYLSAVKDYPLPRNSSAATSFGAAAYAIEIFGYEDE